MRWPWSWLVRLARFSARVLKAFLDNRGILLAGGVGYNALLSVVPFLTLSVAVLSLVFDDEDILSSLRAELRVLVPQGEAAILEIAEAYLQDQATNSVVSMCCWCSSARSPFACWSRPWLRFSTPRARGFSRRCALATVIVTLLFMEIAFIILLLGAQVIAELEHSSGAGLPWWEDPFRPAVR